MKDKGSFAQCYNARAAVDVATMLIVGQHLTDAPNDKEQLKPGLEAVSPAAGKVGRVLVDSGYFGEAAVTGVEAGGEGPEVYAAMKQTVEPVFGIIKEVIGFRCFMLRGKEKAALEWALVSTAYNLKRLFGLGARLTPA